ncbi:MAG: FAD binding domain-containing protein [Anaerocolumna sp.]
MKETVHFFLNGTPQEIQVNAETTVLELLRNNLDLHGIKEGCGEGDCGACTVVLGEVINHEIHYKSIAGCLYLAAKLEGKHLITIEGMQDKDTLHPIQEAILNAHATQCGFCTPGVALSIFALYLEKEHPTKEEFRRYLEGNLCRCTGYTSIRQVPKFLEDLNITSNHIRPSYLTSTEAAQLTLIPEDIFIDDGKHAYYSPISKANLIDFLKGHKALTENGNLCYINGGSDVVVGMKKHGKHYRLLLDLSRIDTLLNITYTPDSLTFGAGVSLSRIIDETKTIFPALSTTVSQMCSEQIRSSASMAGNIVNASPVADTVPLLMAIDARLNIADTTGMRTVSIRDFYLGYKLTDKRPEEWVCSITLPLGEYNFIHFEKVSKRKEVDISSVNSAMALLVEEGVIKKCHLAYGGVGPTTLFMYKTAAYLEGKQMLEETFLKAFALIKKEATPLTDVRSSKEYREALMQNLLMKHYLAYKIGQEV